MSLKKNILTYNGSSTDGLFVLALKNDREVKLKVKDVNCHGAIVTEGLAVSTEPFPSSAALYKAYENGELADGTVYIVIEAGEQKEYFHYKGELTLLGNDGTTSSSLQSLSYGKTFDSFYELINEKEKLPERTIYCVNDKGTVEQYVIIDKDLIQISGPVNIVIKGNSINETEKSIVHDDSDGIIDYNMPELINGDYRYKNHDTLHTVICDMPALSSAVQMFYGCPLTYFAGNLDSLEYAYGMFAKDCRLDYESILNIVDGIKDVNGLDETPRRIDIGYSPENVTEEQLIALNNEFSSKGWLVEWWKNGAKQH